MNIAHEAVDRHLLVGGGDHVALRCLDRHGGRHDVSYAALSRASNRFANVLRTLGVTRSERVFILMPRTADLYVAVLGALKHRCVVSPLFAAFGPEPIHQRLSLGSGRVLVTTAGLYRRKVAPIRDRLPDLDHVLLVTDSAPSAEAGIEGTRCLASLLSDVGDEYEIGRTAREDMALLHFTSGTTGAPKGAIHVHDAVVVHQVSGRIALDLRPDDIYWCTADPGWVTGTSYGVVAPLVLGVTSVVEEGEFYARRWYEVLESQAVTVWYTSPTALRMLMAAGPDLPRSHDLSKLRFVASVGEPLNPEVVLWANEVLGQPVHDNWWQTETQGEVKVAEAAC